MTKDKVITIPFTRSDINDFIIFHGNNYYRNNISLLCNYILDKNKDIFPKLHKNEQLSIQYTTIEPMIDSFRKILYKKTFILFKKIIRYILYHHINNISKIKTFTLYFSNKYQNNIYPLYNERNYAIKYLNDENWKLLNLYQLESILFPKSLELLHKIQNPRFYFSERIYKYIMDRLAIIHSIITSFENEKYINKTVFLYNTEHINSIPEQETSLIFNEIEYYNDVKLHKVCEVHNDICKLEDEF